MDGHVGTGGHALRERAAMADTLHRLGPGAPTLCEGWATEDLAAHIVVRERRPLASAGLVIAPLAGRADRARQRMVDEYMARGDYPGLVEAVRRGPRWGPTRIGRVDELVNVAEFFVHHEDLLRAQPGWRARELGPDYVAALWERVRTFARVRPVRGVMPARLIAPGFGEVSTGGGDTADTVTGTPDELLLWLFGRFSVAGVSVGAAGRERA